MKIVVDTNILFSALLNSQSEIARILLHKSKKINFYSPVFLKQEIQNHFNRIQKFTKLQESEIQELIDFLYSRIYFISEEFIPKEIILKSEELTRSVDFDDVIFVALAIHFNCPLWTGDKKLKKALMKKGFNNFITSAELMDVLIRK